MKIAYIEKKFADSSLAILHQANEIINDYRAQGLSLTLRQLYYRFVATDSIPNEQKQYKRHDPSGIDMTRDICDRLNMFGCVMGVNRIALNMDQVDEHNPPPNPAKLTDSRAMGYIQEFGHSSWELDALEPQVECDP